jgi:hypothetical protein
VGTEHQGDQHESGLEWKRARVVRDEIRVVIGGAHPNI